jgi:hypothetical protein
MGSSSNRFDEHIETDRKMSLFPYLKVLPDEHLKQRCDVIKSL